MTTRARKGLLLRLDSYLQRGDNMNEKEIKRLAAYLFDYIKEDEERGFFDWNEWNLEMAIEAFLGGAAE